MARLERCFPFTDLKDYDSDDDGVNDWYEGREDNLTRSITDPNVNDTDGMEY